MRRTLTAIAVALALGIGGAAAAYADSWTDGYKGTIYKEKQGSDTLYAGYKQPYYDHKMRVRNSKVDKTTVTYSPGRTAQYWTQWRTPTTVTGILP
jgi:hypothetical protein